MSEAERPKPYEMTIRVEIDEHGRLCVFGDEKTMPGLYLAHADHDAVWRDLGMALKYLLLRNHDWPWPSKAGEAVH